MTETHNLVFSSEDDMNKRQINADRRRKGSGPVGRAEEPRRDTGGFQPGGMQSSGGTPRPSSSFGGGTSRGKQVGGCGTVLIIVLFIAYYVFSGGNGLDLGGLTDSGTDGQDQPGFEQVNPELPQSNFTPPAPSTAGGQTWTIMLYQDADDQVLERDIYLDLNEAERVGSSPNVNIVAQMDRFRGAYQGDGDWTSARRYYITQDSDLNAVHSQVAQELGEVDMSDGQTLVEFVQWAAQNFPADKYVLILSDHGMGWPGGWSDPAPGGSGDSSTPLSSRLGNNIYFSELDQALGQARSVAGIDRFEIIGMDACLMAQIESHGRAPAARQLRGRVRGGRTRHRLGLRKFPRGPRPESRHERRTTEQGHRGRLHRGRPAHPRPGRAGGVHARRIAAWAVSSAAGASPPQTNWPRRSAAT